MKTPIWILALVFLGVSIPIVLLLQQFGIGGEFKLLIAMFAGVGATALAQSRRRSRSDGG